MGFFSLHFTCARFIPASRAFVLCDPFVLPFVCTTVLCPFMLITVCPGMFIVSAYGNRHLMSFCCALFSPFLRPRSGFDMLICAVFRSNALPRIYQAAGHGLETALSPASSGSSRGGEVKARVMNTLQSLMNDVVVYGRRKTGT